MKEVFLLVLGAALGWVGQVLFYRYQKRDEQESGPQLAVSKVKRGEHVLLDLRNIGPDSLAEMEVELAWLAHGQQQRKKMSEFYRPEADPTEPLHPELLESGGHLEGRGLPEMSDEGIVDVRITGVGVKSHRLFSFVSQVEVALFRG